MTAVLLLSCLSLLPLAPAPSTPLAEWAADLVASPHFAAADRDAALHGWLDRVLAEPDHPLAAATLQLLSAARHDVADPAALRERFAELDPTRLEPGAAALAERLVGRALAAQPGVVDACFPQQLGQARVLGPLGPLGHPEAFTAGAGLFAAPAYDAVHAGARGELRWRPLTRPAERAAVEAGDALIGGPGWALLAFEFDVPDGGPAWVEVDLGDAAGSSFHGDLGAALSFGSSGFRGWWLGAGREPPAYALSINGADPVVVDSAVQDVGAVVHHPVVLRRGRNRLMFRFDVETGFSAAVAVRGADGRPWPGLVGTLARAPLGEPVDASPPAAWPFGAPSLWAAGGPLAGDDLPAPLLALRGLLRALDRQPARGLADLRSAAELSSDPDLLALVLGVLASTAYLPESWSQPRVRRLIERARALDPDHLPLAIAWSRILVGEDRDEEALQLMQDMTELHPRQADSLLRERSVLLGLGLTPSAEAAVDAARLRAPGSPRVLQAVMGLAREGGRRDELVELLVADVLAQGVTAGRAEGLARQLADLGRHDDAERWWREALARDPDRTRWLRRIDTLAERGDLSAADALLSDLARTWDDWPALWRVAADLSLDRGDTSAELERLARALELDPSHLPTLERWAERTGDDPVEAFYARHDLGRDEVLAAYTERGRDESVVRLLDLGLVWVFEDGATRTYTHEIVQVRDLDACEREGSLRLPGEVRALATITAEGEVYEPALVGGEYVMPNLRPGDFIERVFVTRTGPPSDGVLRPGSWFFQSVREPFLVSRYGIAVPESVPLRLHSSAFDGSHDVERVGGHEVHILERRDSERVLLEPGAPDQRWFVPWVEFGMDAPVAGTLAAMNRPLRVLARPTVEVEAAAEPVVAGLVGDTARARALYDFVGEHLDQTTQRPLPAVTSLLEEEGQPTLLLAALLAAVGIDHELAWSRGLPPGADPEPDPPFVDPRRLQRRLLLVVRPDDGPEVWCDPASQGLPFGTLDGSAPGAEALGVTSGRSLREPEGQPSGNHWRLAIRAAEDGSATVEGSLSLMGAPGFLSRRQFREMPAAYHRPVVQQVASQLLPGLDLSEAAIEGIAAEADERSRFRFTGRQARGFDVESDGALSRNLPLARLGLSGMVATEGTRQLPFQSPFGDLELTEVELTLPDGWTLADRPAGFEGAVEGWSYALTALELAPGRWRIERRFERRPFTLEAGRYHELVAFCARVDEAERARLRVVPLR